MKRLSYLAVLLLFFVLHSSAQNNNRLNIPKLSPTVVNDFAKAVNYSWNYANNTDAFKAALIPGLRHRGIYSESDIIETVQNVSNSKISRDLVLGALFDYAGSGKFEKTLVNMGIPYNSANSLVSYEMQLLISNEKQIGQNLSIKKSYTVIAESAEFKKLPQSSTTWVTDDYSVYGDQVIATKEDHDFLFCEFRDSKTKKIKRGWIDRSLLVESAQYEEKGKSLNTHSPFDSLLELNGLNSDQDYDGQGAFFKRAIIVSELRKIMSADYDKFSTDFLLNCGNSIIEIKYKVLYISLSTFNPPARAVLVIDVLNQKSFLCVKMLGGYNDKPESKYYGKTMLSKNVITFLQSKIQQKNSEANNAYFEEEKKKAFDEETLLKEFLTAYSNYK